MGVQKRKKSKSDHGPIDLLRLYDYPRVTQCKTKTGKKDLISEKCQGCENNSKWPFSEIFANGLVGANKHRKSNSDEDGILVKPSESAVIN